MNQQHQQIRDIQLLKDEEVWMVLHPGLGLLEKTPDQGDCVVLTNQRLLSFRQEQGRHRRTLIPLDAVDAVDLSSTARSPKPLMQGALLLLAAMVVVWLALAFNGLGVLSWLIVATLLLLAAVTASTFFASEQTAVITFRAGASEVTLPLGTAQGHQDAHTLALRFFQARAGQERVDTSVLPVVATVSWPSNSEHGPLEAGEKEDAGNAETPADPMESTQAEGRRDI